jgi:hypothetical protein
LFAVSVVVSLSGAALAAMVAVHGLPAGARASLPMCFVLPPISFAWAVVGALVASRRPGNRIAWVFCAIGLGLALLGASAAYFAYAFYGPFAPLPGAEFAGFATELLFVPCVFIGPVSMFWVFPNGRFLSPSWRLVALTLITVGMLASLASALVPGRLAGLGAVNPLGVDGDLVPVVRFVSDSGAVEGPAAFLAATLGMLARFRRATGVERQQIKWVAYAVILALTAFLVLAVAPVPTAAVFLGSDSVANLPGSFALVVMPVCTGVAILRYRLYEIDAVINRTLVYAALTVSLGAVYLVSVLVLQEVLSAVAGGSSLAVAVSTLAVAAAFGPVRVRIQRFVDRRFFRHKYDATRTLQGFSAWVRGEVAVDAVSAELRHVVSDTMQPAHISVWLRDPR